VKKWLEKPEWTKRKNDTGPASRCRPRVVHIVAVRYFRVGVTGGTTGEIGDIGAATPFAPPSPSQPPLVASCAASTVWITLAI
jgi:hypothetical protein